MSNNTRSDNSKAPEHIALPIIALIFGIIGLVISWVPIINNAAFLFGLIGLTLGLISLLINRKHVKTISIIGTVIAIVSMAIVLFTQYHYSNSIDKAVSEINSSATSHENHDTSSSENSSETSTTNSSSMTPTGEDTSLSAGNWEVGKDIKPGIYVLTTNAGSGNVDSDPKNIDDPAINIILGAGNDENETTNYRAYLKDGDKLNISGLDNVDFQTDQPLNNASSDKYISGEYKIGSDIKPGRYKISAITGSGNLMTSDGNVNEILSADPSDNEVSSTTVNLKQGETLTTTTKMIQLDAE